MRVELPDVVIGAATLVLLVGLIALVGIGREVPVFLQNGFAAALGAVVGRAPTTIQNGRNARTTP